MFGGGGGLNPRKMKQMMEQMGIDVEEIDAEEVVIRTPDGDLVFPDADVTRMDARGQQTYQIVGEPETREAGGDEAAGGGDDGGGDDGGGDDGGGDDGGGDDGGGDDDGAAILDEDVELVAGRTGAGEAEARAALEEADGDLAAAIERLE